MNDLNEFNYHVGPEIDIQKDKEYHLFADDMSELQKKAFSVFQVVDNLDDEAMLEFLMCVRVLHYEGDEIDSISSKIKFG
jgi:hypothetical protein